MIASFIFVFIVSSQTFTSVVSEKDSCFADEHKCLDGSCISLNSLCDGRSDCLDGSDEKMCLKSNPLSEFIRFRKKRQAQNCGVNEWQCLDGTCIGLDGKCNRVVDCPDFSDEMLALCRKLPLQERKCLLPPYPEYGTYTVHNNPAATPGKRYPNVMLQISCNTGFQVENNTNIIFCVNGDWSSNMPRCVRFCRLNKHPSVEYRCLLTVPGSLTISQECGSLEPSGTVARPVCRSPNYYSSELLTNMHCVEGTWDHVATCQPECGTITQEGIQRVIGEKAASRGELPWHAGIYSTLYSPYMQICGGSLISNTIIISAAHCFWSDAKELLPAVNFAVAVGKLYRPYNEKRDVYAEKSDVADIIIPNNFQGATTNYQDDIALVKVVTPFTYNAFIRPICLHFDVTFEKTQLSQGNKGKVAGWGLASRTGRVSQVLKVVDLPYVEVEDCYAMTPLTFRAYITSDKICAGYTNGTTLCQGDSGGGLAFPAYELNTKRYYLRGIVSTTESRNDDLCNANTFTTFTSTSKHEHFIKQYL